MPFSLEDSSITPAVAGSQTGAVQLADLYALDVRTIYNKSIYAFLAQWGLLYFNLDNQIFSPADTDMMLALKNTGLMVGIDIIAAQTRKMFPQLVL